MGKKLRAYFCSGCGIGSAVSIPDLEKTANETSKNTLSITVSESLCAPEVQKTIEQDIASADVDACVVFACSERTREGAFRFDSSARNVNALSTHLPKPFEQVALRERVTYVLAPSHEDTQLAAEDYVRMGVVKLLKTEPLVPSMASVSRSVLVVGGGITGISAALALADAGVRVVLVEKEDRLGGWVANWRCLFPARPPYGLLIENRIADKIDAVEKHERILVCRSSRILSVSGQPGAFEAHISEGGKDRIEQVSAIVQATGWQPYDATLLSSLGYGTSKDVITQIELEKQLIETNSLVRPSDGSVPRSVVFVQCAGSRDEDHLPTCSTVCCRTTLRQARMMRERCPDTVVTVLYKDIRAPGQFEEFYECVQEDVGVFMLRGDVTGVVAEDGSLVVAMKDSLLGNRVEVQAELVVLVVGMVPVSGESILNLSYRKGRELPVDKHGFADSHFVCFPYETQRTGIYAAGCVREPMDSDACAEDAAGAALKAIQCIVKAQCGESMQPRAGDISVPEFFLGRCTQCKRCTEECPFGALDEDEKGTPKPNPNRCRRCGVCMGACPERVVSFKNCSVDMVGSMIKAIEIPDETDEKPRYLALVCENDILPALDLAAAARTKLSPWVRVVPVRCLGSINVQWVSDAIIKGMDGVMLIGCKSGDDYQCHFIHGSELCGVRMSKIQETLTRLQLEPERVVVKECAMGDFASLPLWINETVEKLDALGPNPNKGF